VFVGLEKNKTKNYGKKVPHADPILKGNAAAYNCQSWRSQNACKQSNGETTDMKQ